MSKLMRLHDHDAIAHWQQFEADLKKRLSALGKAERAEVVAELGAHVQESMSRPGRTGSERERLQAAIEDLGSPDEYVAHWVAEWRLDQRASRGSLGALARLLFLRSGRSIAWSLAAMVTGLALVFSIMIGVFGIASLFVDSAGLWIHGDGSWTLSFEAQDRADQWRPKLFGWLAIAGAVGCYVAVTIGVRRAVRASR